jgi:hypothetical protein
MLNKQKDLAMDLKENEYPLWIRRSAWGTLINVLPDTPQGIEIPLRNAALCFGFLLKQDETLTYTQFAVRISEFYSLADPKTNSVVRVLLEQAENFSQPARQIEAVSPGPL